MRNVTEQTTVNTSRQKVKTHLNSGKIADFLFVIPVTIFSFVGHLCWSFIANGKVICGGFLMCYAFYLSTENYFKLLSRSSLTRGLEASLGNFWVAVTVLTAVLLGATIEYIQTEGHREFRKAQKKVKISGERSTNNSIIVAGFIATICEFVGFVFLAWLEGITPIKIIQLAIALWGFKFGFDWFVSFQEDKLRNSNPVDYADIPQPKAPAADIPKPQSATANPPQAKAPAANPPQPKAPTDIPQPRATQGGQTNAS